MSIKTLVTLVTYVTRAGSTAEVAHSIAEVLTSHGAAVDVLPLKEVASLQGYQAVVLGSAVRMGAWLPEAVKFVEQNREALDRVHSAFFAVHLMNLGEDETSRQARLAYLDPVRKLMKPCKEAFFAGVGDWKKVTFLEKMMAKMVKAPEGDFRNWPVIRSWAEELCQDGFAGEPV